MTDDQIDVPRANLITIVHDNLLHKRDAFI
jgi:hypothetical protein